jgi:hypothetical protein
MSYKELVLELRKRGLATSGKILKLKQRLYGSITNELKVSENEVPEEAKEDPSGAENEEAGANSEHSKNKLNKSTEKETVDKPPAREKVESENPTDDSKLEQTQNNCDNKCEKENDFLPSVFPPFAFPLDQDIGDLASILNDEVSSRDGSDVPTLKAENQSSCLNVKDTLKQVSDSLGDCPYTTAFKFPSEKVIEKKGTLEEALLQFGLGETSSLVSQFPLSFQSSPDFVPFWTTITKMHIEKLCEDAASVAHGDMINLFSLWMTRNDENWGLGNQYLVVPSDFLLCFEKRMWLSSFNSYMKNILKTAKEANCNFLKMTVIDFPIHEGWHWSRMFAFNRNYVPREDRLDSDSQPYRCILHVDSHWGTHDAMRWGETVQNLLKNISSKDVDMPLVVIDVPQQAPGDVSCGFRAMIFSFLIHRWVLQGNNITIADKKNGFQRLKDLFSTVTDEVVAAFECDYLKLIAALCFADGRCNKTALDLKAMDDTDGVEFFQKKTVFTKDLFDNDTKQPLGGDLTVHPQQATTGISGTSHGSHSSGSGTTNDQPPPISCAFASLKSSNGTAKVPPRKESKPFATNTASDQSEKKSPGSAMSANGLMSMSPPNTEVENLKPPPPALLNVESIANHRAEVKTPQVAVSSNESTLMSPSNSAGGKGGNSKPPTPAATVESTASHQAEMKTPQVVVTSNKSTLMSPSNTAGSEGGNLKPPPPDKSAVTSDSEETATGSTSKPLLTAAKQSSGKKRKSNTLSTSVRPISGMLDNTEESSDLEEDMKRATKRIRRKVGERAKDCASVKDFGVRQKLMSAFSSLKDAQAMTTYEDPRMKKENGVFIVGAFAYDQLKRNIVKTDLKRREKPMLSFMWSDEGDKEQFIEALCRTHYVQVKSVMKRLKAEKNANVTVDYPPETQDFYDFEDFVDSHIIPPVSTTPKKKNHACIHSRNATYIHTLGKKGNEMKSPSAEA